MGGGGDGRDKKGIEGLGSGCEEEEEGKNKKQGRGKGGGGEELWEEKRG